MVDRNMNIKIARLLISVFIFYEMFIKEAFGNYAIILYGTVVLATAFVAIDIMGNAGKLPVLGFPLVLLGYGIYSFITGCIVSRDMSWFYSIMVTYFAFSIVCFDCCYIIKRNESSEWLLNVFLVTACACAMQTIFFGADYRTEVIVRTMSINNNPNVLGLTMIIGIFSLISRKKYVVKRFWIYLTIALVFLYVILLTASRKCLFCALALIAVWIVSALKTDRQFSARKITMIVGIIIALGIGIYYFLTKYSSTSSFARMLLLNSGASTRANLYHDAIEYWKTSPVIGIGFCQYQIWSPYRLYSHSSYAEILCCTGLIGVAIFFTPIIYILYKNAKATIIYKGENRYDNTMCLAMVIIELALGVGQIYLYDVSHLLMWSYLSLAIDSILIEKQRDTYIQEQYGNEYINRRFFKRKVI